MPAARARTWATREASMRPGNSVLSPTVRGVAVTTPTSAGGGLAAVGSAFGAQAARASARPSRQTSSGTFRRGGAASVADGQTANLTGDDLRLPAGQLPPAGR